MTMRLPIVRAESEDTTPGQRAALEEWGADRGQTTPPGDIWGVLVESPAAMRWVGKLGAFARVGTSLPKDLRECAALVAVSVRGFQFEIDIHTRNLRGLGADDAMIDALLGRDTDQLGPEAKAVADLAWAMTDGAPVPDEVFVAARSVLGDEHLTELVVATAYFMMLSDIANVFVTPTDG